MSDLLLVGDSPKEDAGTEYFLHCMDWWFDILRTIEEIVDESFPFYDVFYRDLLLTPMTPHLDSDQAVSLAKLLREKRESGDLLQALDRILTENIDEDEEDRQAVLDDRMDDRTTQIEELIDFLDACGGCRAKWYSSDD